MFFTYAGNGIFKMTWESNLQTEEAGFFRMVFINVIHLNKQSRELMNGYVCVYIFKGFYMESTRLWKRLWKPSWCQILSGGVCKTRISN